MNYNFLKYILNTLLVSLLLIIFTSCESDDLGDLNGSPDKKDKDFTPEKKIITNINNKVNKVYIGSNENGRSFDMNAYNPVDFDK